MNKKLRLLQVLSVILSLICIYFYTLRMTWERIPTWGLPFPQNKVIYLFWLVLVGLLHRLPRVIIEGREKFTFDWITFLIYGLPPFSLALFSIYNIHRGLLFFWPLISLRIPYVQLAFPGFPSFPRYEPVFVSPDWYVVHAICSIWLGAALALSIREKDNQGETMNRAE